MAKRTGMAERKVDSERCFSYYYQTREEVPKIMYNEKLAMLGSMEDHYATIASASSEANVDWQHWPDIHVVEIIPIDKTFRTDALEKATSFFTYGILPEIPGKWYSKSHEYSSAESPQASVRLQQNTSQEIWRFCRSEESGEMIARKMNNDR